MPETQPRYEFRVFAENLVPVFQTMKEMAGRPLVRESSEIYIVSEFCWDTNVKIRGGVLDIKILLQVRDGLEQWVPKAKRAFPLDRKFIEAEILDDISIDSDSSLPELSDVSYSLEQFLEWLKKLHGVKAIRVKKKRFGFLKEDVILEFAELMIDGKPIHTVAVEGTDPGKVLKWMKGLDIDKRENVNYPLAIRRMVGMEQEEAGDHC
jgi:hypothetical protein